MQRGANVPRLRNYNQRLVLDSVRRRPAGVSRVELAGITGLTAQTISNLTRRLLDEGLLLEGAQERHGPGKPRTLLVANPRGMYSIGVHLDPSGIRTCLLNLEGEVLASTHRVRPFAEEPDATLQAIEDTVRRTLAGRRIGWESLAGLGIATPGPVDIGRGVVVDPPLLAGWHDVPLRDQLSERLDLPVVMEKDVVAAAAGELWLRGAEDAPSFAFLYLGTGIGLGVVHRGEVLRGATDNFGDVGHLIISTDTAVCPCCGDLRCRLGNVTLPKHLVNQAREAGVLPPGDDSPTMHIHGLSELCRLAASGDAGALAVLAPCRDGIATALTLLSDLLDVDEVVLGGAYWEPLSPVLSESIAHSIGERAVLRSVRPVRLRDSRNGSRAAAVGAASLALGALVSASPHTLMASTAPISAP